MLYDVIARRHGDSIAFSLDCKDPKEAYAEGKKEATRILGNEMRWAGGRSCEVRPSVDITLRTP